MKSRVIIICEKGFSLVELLLGLAITAIIGLAVYNMFWSAMKLDDKMRRVHDTYMEVLMADQALSHDLENAIDLDYSGSYLDAVIFDGQKDELSFLTQTPKGIRRVHYYSGMKDGKIERSMIGRIVNESSASISNSKEPLPVEFLLRQESSLGDWLNETNNDTTTQVVAGGLEKGSFNCMYAPFKKDLHDKGAQDIEYSDSWDKKGLPLAVSCNFNLYDSQKRQEGLAFKRDIFLAPVPNYHHEQ